MLTQQAAAENRGGCGAGLVGGFRGEKAIRDRFRASVMAGELSNEEAVAQFNAMLDQHNENPRRHVKRFNKPPRAAAAAGAQRAKRGAALLRAELKALREATRLCRPPAPHVALAELQEVYDAANAHRDPRPHWTELDAAHWQLERAHRANLSKAAARAHRAARAAQLRANPDAPRAQMDPQRRARMAAGAAEYRAFVRQHPGVSRDHMKQLWAQHKAARGVPLPADDEEDILAELLGEGLYGRGSVGGRLRRAQY